MNNDISTYLKGLKSSFLTQNNVTVVMGNEAADMDSIVSAVCYAWYLYLSDSSQNSFPLINIPRKDFELRSEAVYLFNEAGIDIDYLLFSEDIDLYKLKISSNLKLVLVDHNKLTSAQSGLKTVITEILDHHVDEKSYPASTVTNIKKVGSVTTIVTDFFLKDKRNFIKGTTGLLLLGTILLDTLNLDPKAGIVTNDDSRVAKELISITGLDSGKLFEKLQFEKLNMSSLCSYDLLRRDYKEWQFESVRLGISSILLPVEVLASNATGLVNGCSRYLKERKLDVLLAMNTYRSPKFTRQLIVYIPDNSLRTKTIFFLETSPLDLKKLNIGTFKEEFNLYNQKNLNISRKRFQILLKDYFEI